MVSLLTAGTLGVRAAQGDDEGEEVTPQTVDKAQAQGNNNHQHYHGRPAGLSVNLKHNISLHLITS